MFAISIKAAVRPSEWTHFHGLPVVDLRRAAGLPEGTDPKIPVEWVGVSESVCREFAPWLDGSADLPVVVESYRGVLQVKHGVSLGEPSAPLALLLPFARGAAAEDDARALLAHWRDRLAEEERQQQERQRQERQRREAAEAERDRQRREKEQREAEGLARLREWAEASGSELVRERIAGGFAWADLARGEWTAAALAAVRGDLADAPPLPDHTSDTEPRRSPALAEMRALKDLRGRIEAAGLDADAELVMVTYTPTDGAGHDYDEPEPIRRPELEVTFTAPAGTPQTEYLLPPVE